mmetsp:Transcript_15676/g.49955  ORF Transcript_15676/g.49955 Transcript_15676/m.49955 type:complete len:262 (-) Transcript_15676:596-1381(-)
MMDGTASRACGGRMGGWMDCTRAHCGAERTGLAGHPARQEKTHNVGVGKPAPSQPRRSTALSRSVRAPARGRGRQPHPIIRVRIEVQPCRPLQQRRFAVFRFFSFAVALKLLGLEPILGLVAGLRLAERVVPALLRSALRLAFGPLIAVQTRVAHVRRRALLLGDVELAEPLAPSPLLVEHMLVLALEFGVVEAHPEVAGSARDWVGVGLGQRLGRDPPPAIALDAAVPAIRSVQRLGRPCEPRPERGPAHCEPRGLAPGP